MLQHCKQLLVKRNAFTFYKESTGTIYYVYKMFSSALWLARRQILLDFSPSRREQENYFHLNPPAAGSRLNARANS